MLKTLSYINLMLAVAYFLIWLQQGSYYAMTGIALLVLFCIYTLWAIENEKWGSERYIAAVPALLIAGWLLISGVNLMLSSLDSGYQVMGIVFLYIYCLVFGTALLAQVVLLLLKSRQKAN